MFTFNLLVYFYVSVVGVVILYLLFNTWIDDFLVNYIFSPFRDRVPQKRRLLRRILWNGSFITFLLLSALWVVCVYYWL